MGEESEFDRARRQRLLSRDSAATTPSDALALAADYVKQEGVDHVVIVLERATGGVTLFTAGTTLAVSVFLLEAAKMTLLRPEDREGE
jgi:hypothetical protein